MFMINDIILKYLATLPKRSVVYGIWYTGKHQCSGLGVSEFLFVIINPPYFPKLQNAKILVSLADFILSFTLQSSLINVHQPV